MATNHRTNRILFLAIEDTGESSEWPSQIVIVDANSGDTLMWEHIMPESASQERMRSLSRDCSPFKDIHADLEAMLTGATVVAWHASLAHYTLKNMCRRHSLPFPSCSWRCALIGFEDAQLDPRKSLPGAARHMGVWPRVIHMYGHPRNDIEIARRVWIANKRRSGDPNISRRPFEDRRASAIERTFVKIRSVFVNSMYNWLSLMFAFVPFFLVMLLGTALLMVLVFIVQMMFGILGIVLGLLGNLIESLGSR